MSTSLSNISPPGSSTNGARSALKSPSGSHRPARGSRACAAVELYQKMLHETDPAKQRALMRAFEKHTLDDEVHNITTLWWYRIVPHRSYVKGWKISPIHFLNQELATIWLDK